MNGLVMIASNLKYRKLGGIESQGMIFCGSKENIIEILRPEKEIQVGERVILEGTKIEEYNQSDKQLNPKKKILENILPDLFVNSNKQAQFLDFKLITQTGSYITTQSIFDGKIS